GRRQAREDDSRARPEALRQLPRRDAGDAIGDLGGEQEGHELADARLRAAREQLRVRELVELAQLRLRVLQPRRHRQALEDGDGGGEMLAGLRLLSDPAVERSEAAMTVADEGTHSEVGGQAPGLSKVLFGGLDVRRVAA